MKEHESNEATSDDTFFATNIKDNEKSSSDFSPFTLTLFQTQAKTLTKQILHRPFLQITNNPTNVRNNNNSQEDLFMMQCSNPFITPSLLSSHQNAFSHSSLNSINNNKDKSNSNNQNNDEDNNCNVSTIPSVIGMEIDTPLQLLYSLHCIEVDYYVKHPTPLLPIDIDKSFDGNDNDNSGYFNNHTARSREDHRKMLMKLHENSIISMRYWNELNDFLHELVVDMNHNQSDTGSGDNSNINDGNDQNNIGIMNNNHRRRIGSRGDDFELLSGMARIGTGASRDHFLLPSSSSRNNNRGSQRNIRLLQNRIRLQKKKKLTLKKNNNFKNGDNSNDDNKMKGIEAQQYLHQCQKDHEEKVTATKDDREEGCNDDEHYYPLVNLLNEERDETIAQLTHLVLDSTPYMIPFPPTSSSLSSLSSPNLSPSIKHQNYTKYKPSSSSFRLLSTKYSHIPKRVCQYPFQKNDIVWVCKTCQADETCVLCHECYSHSNHDGHDVAFYHAQAGGCCDCGDEDAWDPKGFCHLHGCVGSSFGGRGLEKDIEWKVKGIIHSCVDYIGLLADNIALGYERANGGRIVLHRSESRHSHALSYDEGDKAMENDNGSMEKRCSLVGLKRKNDKPHEDVDDEIDSSDDNIMGVHFGHSEAMHVDELKNQKVDTYTSINSQEQENLSDMDIVVTSSPGANRSEFKFNPAAASMSKSRSDINTPKRSDQRLQEQIFNPEAASKSKSRSYLGTKKMFYQQKETPISTALSPSHQLGLLGLQQQGLYLVLHADEVHKKSETVSALTSLYQSLPSSSTLFSRGYDFDSYYSQPSITLDSVTNLIPELFNHPKEPLGDIIVWGTFELMEELGPILSQCWKDGDSAACARFGALMLDKAAILIEKGFIVSIKTRLELCKEVRGLAALEFLKILSDCCDPLCSLVSLALDERLNPEKNQIETDRDVKNIVDNSNNLKSMLKNDLKLPRMIANAWHDLLLKLLAIPSFKASLSNAYVDTYSDVSYEYAKGIGILAKSSYTLSVQFLNRITYVQDLVKQKDLLGCLIRCLLGALQVAKVNTNHCDSMNEELDVTHTAITHRRYQPPIGDLKCILNVPGISHFFSSIPHSLNNNSPVKPCLDAWINTLTLAQNMDPQKWRPMSEGHIEIESMSWIPAFNLSISLGSLFEKLLLWKDEDHYLDHSNGLPLTFLTAIELTEYVMINGVYPWQKHEINHIVSDIDMQSSKEKSMNLPISTIAIRHGCPLFFNALPIAQTDKWSFHIPLHRFLSACVKEVAKRPSQANKTGIELLLSKLLTSLSDETKLATMLNGLVEFPLRVLSGAAQIMSNLWKRNGSIMKVQVLNYAQPSFCKCLRDADLLLVQFALVAGCFLENYQRSKNQKTDFCTSQCFTISNFVCLSTHRFGVFDFLGFTTSFAMEEDVAESFAMDDNTMEVVGEAGNIHVVSSITKDPDRLAFLLDEFLYFLIILITELPAPEVRDEAEYLSQAKQRLRREVVHRLVSGPKAHSDMCELHHVLPHQDDVALSDEGKFVNPEDATGAALEAVLVEVADCKSFRGKSDQWVLQRWAWNEYDPSFFHASTQCHQDAAENRPIGMVSSETSKTVASFPYAPFPPQAHESFMRLRKDLTADSSIIATCYRVLHTHFHNDIKISAFNSELGYDKSSHSEIVVGRVIHLLTLGAYAWDDTNLTESNKAYGVNVGSVLYNQDTPTQQTWVEKTFLNKPNHIMCSEKYDGEESMLELINKLAVKGGSKHFEVQDRAIRAGAAWLEEYVIRSSPKAAEILGKVSEGSKPSMESDFHRRKREAKERAMKHMQQKIIHFNDMSKKIGKVDTNSFSSDNQDSVSQHNLEGMDLDNQNDDPFTPQTIENMSSLLDRPECIICGFDKNRDNTEKVLAYCGFIQPSSVLNGGQNTPFDKNSSLAHAGVHISLCGHAIHSTCCESHLNDILAQENRLVDRHHFEFRCPLCRRLSNCLIPFIDIGKGWVKKAGSETRQDDGKGQGMDTNLHATFSLHEFLCHTKWWTTHNNQNIIWDGRCSFIPSKGNEMEAASKSQDMTPETSMGKKDVYKAWSSILMSPVFIQEVDEWCESQYDSLTLSPAIDVWKRVLDLIVEVSYKADIKQFGEKRLYNDFGEFRHFVVEKIVLEQSTWPSCIPRLSSSTRQGLSKEKLISKLFNLFKALTYSCCSEEVECKRQAQTAASSELEVKTKFGISRISCNRRLLILPNNGFDKELFRGRFGRLRYFALSAMVATNPLSQEVVQLALDLPVDTIKCTTQECPRAPIVFPLLCGHILTHIVAAMCTSCGIEGTKHLSYGSSFLFGGNKASFFDKRIISNVSFNYIEECKSFIQLGYIARVLQSTLGFLQDYFFKTSELEWEKYENKVLSLITHLLEKTHIDVWERECCDLLRIALQNHSKKVKENCDEKDNTSNVILSAIRHARQAGYDFLCSACLLLQLLAPDFVYEFDHVNDDCEEDKLYDILSISLKKMLESTLVREIVGNWYLNAKPRLEKDAIKKRLQCRYIFKTVDWPCILYGNLGSPLTNNALSPSPTLPLFQGFLYRNTPIDDKPRINKLPVSYTDLYAQLSPVSESIALCLICGEVLSADGKSECANHTLTCGLGCGIFFLVQRCSVLIIHRDKQMIIPGPYVDSHGETPHYRGRPLHLIKARYDDLHALWSEHAIRAKVIGERSMCSYHDLREIDEFKF